MDTDPPPVGGGRCGQALDVTYKEEVVGSVSTNHSVPIPPIFS